MTSDKQASTPYPHYTNSRFREPQTVYLSANCRLNKDRYVQKAEYNYSDRLVQWYGYAKSSEADETAKESGFNRWSAAWAEIWLRTLLDDPKLELVHMMAGFNWSNGFAYWVYGYITGKPSA